MARILHRFVLFSTSHRLSRRPPPPCQARGYALHYKQPKEESLAYAEFRRKVRALRHEFRDDIEKKNREKLDLIDAQSSEEARVEREIESKALEANALELEKRALRRWMLIHYSSFSS